MPTRHVFRSLFATSLLLALTSSACRTVSLGSSESTTPEPSATRAPEPRDESRQIRNLRTRAAHDLNCGEAKLQIRELGRGTQGVSGCGQRATYLLVGPLGDRRWVMNNEGGGGGAGGESTAPPASDRIVRKTSDGKTTLALDFVREDLDLLVKLKARPADYPDQALLVFEARTKHARTFMHECNPRIVVDGNLVATPPSTFKHVNLIESRSIELRMAELQALSQASRVLNDVCGKRVELTREELSLVQQFLVRFKEELALAGVPAPAAAPATPAEQPEGQESL